MATKKFAYIKREWKNGRWQYTYPDDIKAKKNVLTGQVKSKGYGSLDTHKHAMKQIERDVERNSSSRNIPSSETSSGKQMSKLQQDKAKYMAKANQQNIKNNGPKSNWGKNNFNEVATKDWHKQQLNSATNVSRNTQKSNETTTSSNQLSKKDIKKAVFKAKVNTLKRDAAKAIDRAKKWFEDLFD